MLEQNSTSNLFYFKLYFKLSTLRNPATIQHVQTKQTKTETQQIACKIL